MHWRLGGLSALVLMGACARSSGRATPAQPAAPPRDASACEPLDERFEAMLRARDGLSDWRSTVFGLRAENGPVARRLRPIPKPERLGTAHVATVRAYHYVGDFLRSETAELDDAMPYARDGRLALRVVPPEVTLSENETHDVARLIERAEAAFDEKRAHRGRMRCGFDPHHVLVLFDEARQPIRKLFVCFECGEVLSLPRSSAFGGETPARMTDDEIATLRAIFDAHGLGAWIYGETEQGRQLSAYEERVYGTPTEPTERGRARMRTRNGRPSGVRADLTPKTVEPIERDRLCVWLREEMYTRNRQLSYGVLGSFDCGNGTVYRFSTDVEHACSEEALCDVPLGRMEACLRATVLEGAKAVCASGVPAECVAVMPCLPWVDWPKRR